MDMNRCTPRALMALVLFAVLTPMSRAERDRFPIDNATYRNECASCHIAYPPQLLPAESWRQLMRALDKHFGSDASLDLATAREIERHLAMNASRAQPGGKSISRITETRWFVREHDEVSPGAWKSAAVGSPANCAACHTKAEQGDFGERNLRVPK
jgi:hypothetical protein